MPRRKPKPDQWKRRKSDHVPVEMRTSDSAHWFAQAIIVACLLGVAIWVGVVSGHISAVADKQSRVAQEQRNEAAQLADQKANLIDACNRLNTVRRSDNAAHLGTFELFKFIIAAQANPAQQAAEKTQHLTAAQKALVKAEIAQINSTMLAQSWTPLQNCVQTINQHGGHYKIPSPISFLTARPPKGALLIPSKPKKALKLP
jgi:hypothetical protein